MLEQPSFLITLLHCCEILAALVALVYLKKVKTTYWKWFVFYLVYIVVVENALLFLRYYFNFNGEYYFAFASVPIEFLFFIWLYAFKSLENKKLFWISSVIYLVSFIPEESISQGEYYFSSFNYIVGSLILLGLVCLEFNKQIKSDAILAFKDNKMFYITIGVVLFYIGNLPFFGLYYPIMNEPSIWNKYYIYFMVSNDIMYLLFAASFIWGKAKS